MRGTLMAIAALALVLALPAAAGAADSIYWNAGGSPGEIGRAALDGNGGSVLPVAGGTLDGPLGSAIDSATGRIYWVNGGGSVSYANLDGSGGGGLLNAAGARFEEPRAATIDPVGRRIYWAEEEGISYANLDGSGGGVLNTAGAPVVSPEGVAIDPTANRIYWANFYGSSIGYANLDGSGGDELNTAGAPKSNPDGVAIDPVARRLYWANFGGPEPIAYANLDGSGTGTLNVGGASTVPPRGVAIDPEARRIYWGNESQTMGSISYADLEGAGGGVLPTSGAPLEWPAFPILQKAPVAVAPPSISGGPVAGDTLSCSQGAWAPDSFSSQLYREPSSYAYAWLRDGSVVPGAEQDTYVPVAAGAYVCRVTAANQAGSAVQTSTAAQVSERPPTPPKLHGKAIAAGRAKVKHGRALLRMRCPYGGGDCKGVVKLIMRIKPKHHTHRPTTRRGRRVLLGKRAFRIVAGRGKIVRVRLNRVGRKRLRRAPHHRFAVRLRGGGVRYRGLQLRLAPSRHRRS